MDSVTLTLVMAVTLASTKSPGRMSMALGLSLERHTWLVLSLVRQMSADAFSHLL